MPPRIPSIPRFLLPQRGSIWTTPSSFTTTSIRNASHKAPKKPLVLEKPTKFNPPSHGARQTKGPPRYLYSGPQLSAEQLAAQKTKKYPNLMPAEGTFMHWFLHNKAIHLWITLSTLFFMASFVWTTNFKRDSPFAHMLPSWGETFVHPINSTKMFFQVLRLNTEYTGVQTAERRKRKVEDVQKRAEYRKAHGLDQDERIGGWTAKSDQDSLGPSLEVGDGSVGVEQHVERQKRPPVKKWLGIW